MLPIIAGGIEGRRVSIFNGADGLAHPMRGVEIRNTTGVQLMPGPVAVFDGSAYAGDAQIGHVARGDERLLAYAADLEVDARIEQATASLVQKLRLVRGVLQQQVMDRRAVHYLFESTDRARDRRLIVEHPKLDGWDLIESPSPAEAAEGLYRFELELGAGERADSPSPSSEPGTKPSSCCRSMLAN
jgi:hypothetical protein